MTVGAGRRTWSAPRPGEYFNTWHKRWEGSRVPFSTLRHRVTGTQPELYSLEQQMPPPAHSKCLAYHTTRTMRIHPIKHRSYRNGQGKGNGNTPQPPRCDACRSCPRLPSFAQTYHGKPQHRPCGQRLPPLETHSTMNHQARRVKASCSVQLVDSPSLSIEPHSGQHCLSKQRSGAKASRGTATRTPSWTRNPLREINPASCGRRVCSRRVSCRRVCCHRVCCRHARLLRSRRCPICIATRMPQ